jgi:hypothetical protein
VERQLSNSTGRQSRLRLLKTQIACYDAAVKKYEGGVGIWRIPNIESNSNCIDALVLMLLTMHSGKVVPIKVRQGE